MRLKLCGGFETIVDDDDVIRLQLKGVYPRKTPNGVYAYNMNGDIHRQVIGAKKGQIVDHINFDTLDNRMENLRLCNDSQSVSHRRKYTKGVGVSRFKGVKPNCGGWLARGYIEGKCVNIGNFSTEEEAAKAYDVHAIEHYGAFAELNFPQFDYAGYASNPNKAKRVRVVQLSESMQLVATFTSMSQAEKATGVDHSHIRKICRGTCHPTRGMSFRFAEAI